MFSGREIYNDIFSTNFVQTERKPCHVTCRVVSCVIYVFIKLIVFNICNCSVVSPNILTVLIVLQFRADTLMTKRIAGIVELLYDCLCIAQTKLIVP